MKQITFALALGSMAALGNVAASAATFQVTYNGRVSEGSDVNGVFGSVGSLADKSFTATFVFDNSITPVYYQDMFIATFFQYGGGPDLLAGTVSPLTSATLSIGSSASVGFITSQYSYLASNYYSAGGVYHEYSVTVETATTNLFAYIFNNGNPLGNGPAIDAPFSYTVVSDDVVGGTFKLADGSFGNLIVENLTVGPVSEVPIPAALPLFLGGVGAIAFVARRRKQRLETA